MYTIWQEQQAEKYNAMLDQKKYNEDLEISHRINQTKLAEIREELLGNKKLSIYHGILKKIEEDKIQLDDNDFTPVL